MESLVYRVAMVYEIYVHGHIGYIEGSDTRPLFLMMISASIIYVEALRDFSNRQDDTIGTFLFS